MLTTFDSFIGRLARRDPWTDVVGLSRTLLASGIFLTLALNPVNVLFHPSADIGRGCESIWRIGLFCISPPSHSPIGRWIGVIIALVTLSGWRPRVTAVPFWWVAVSLSNGATVIDGGDQVTAALALLLVPIGLTDRRKWHWTDGAGQEDARPYAKILAWSSLGLIRLQVFGVYLTAAIGKLAVPEWVDGTATYYYFTNPAFGSFSWWRTVLTSSMIVSALTWGTIVLEFALSGGLVLRKELRRPLLIAGLLFHIGIAVILGLPSFAIAMSAALILYLRPADEPFTLVKRLRTLRGDDRSPAVARETRARRPVSVG